MVGNIPRSAFCKGGGGVNSYTKISILQWGGGGGD